MGHGAEAAIWTDLETGSYYLVPAAVELRPGTRRLRDAAGDIRTVELSDLAPFEITEDQAVRWTRANLPDALTELRASLDQTLAEARARLEAERNTPVAPDTTVTPNAVPALFDFLRALPGIVGGGISGDASRVAAARERLADIRRDLAAGGIELDERFTGFADRLAALREDFRARRDEARDAGPSHGEPTSDAPTGDAPTGDAPTGDAPTDAAPTRGEQPGDDQGGPAPGATSSGSDAPGSSR